MEINSKKKQESAFCRYRHPTSTTTSDVVCRRSLTKTNCFLSLPKSCNGTLYYLKTLHRSLLDDFVDVKILTSSSERITGSFFKNQNLSRFKKLRTCTLNNDNKTAGAFRVLFSHCLWHRTWKFTFIKSKLLLELIYHNFLVLFYVGWKSI